MPGTWPARCMGSVGSGNQIKCSGEKAKATAVGHWIDLMPTVKTEGMWIGHREHLLLGGGFIFPDGMNRVCCD